MTEKMMTPLRQRMIDDMTIRNLSPSTVNLPVNCNRNGLRYKALLYRHSVERPFLPVFTLLLNWPFRSSGRHRKNLFELFSRYSRFSF